MILGGTGSTGLFIYLLISLATKVSLQCHNYFNKSKEGITGKIFEQLLLQFDNYRGWLRVIRTKNKLWRCLKKP